MRPRTPDERLIAAAPIIGLSLMPNGTHSTRCDRNADAVIEERPEQVLTDVADGLPRQTDRVHCVHEVALHQHNIRRRDRDIRARADGNADIGTRKRRCIVDAVADHCDPAACGLLLAHDALFVLRQDLCDDLANAKFRGDGLRGLFLSPVSSVTSMPMLSSALTAARLVGLSTSATAKVPTT